jgi:Mg2+-importing ATPase
LVATTTVIAIIGTALPFTPPGAWLGFVPLPPAYWIAMAVIVLGYAVLTHLAKVWFIRRYGSS